MPTPIQQGRTLSALIEEFGLKGRHLLQLDEVVVPVVMVADVTDADSAFVGPSEYTEGIVEAAVVGEAGICEFAGQAGMVMLPLSCYVYFGTIAAPAAGVARIQFDDAAVAPVFTAPSSTRGIDKRDPDGPGAPVGVTSGTFVLAGLTGNSAGQFGIGTTGRVLDLSGWEIRNGERLYVLNETANQETRFIWTWTYRVEE